MAQFLVLTPEEIVELFRQDPTTARDGDCYAIGQLEIRAMETPGHTDDHLAYALFEVPPFHKKKIRLVKKEKKVYFYNWLGIEEEAKRFENYVALELKSRIDLWNDSLEDDYELFFVRGRDGRESDFLITKNHVPL